MAIPAVEKIKVASASTTQSNQSAISQSPGSGEKATNGVGGVSMNKLPKHKNFTQHRPKKINGQKNGAENGQKNGKPPFKTKGKKNIRRGATNHASSNPPHRAQNLGAPAAFPMPQKIPVGGKSRYLALISLERTLIQKKPFQLQIGQGVYEPAELAAANRLCQTLFRNHAALQILAGQLLTKPLRPQDRKFSLLIFILLVEMIINQQPAHAVSVIIRFLAGVMGERGRANVLQAVVKRIERETPTLPTVVNPSPVITKHQEVYGKEASDAMTALYESAAPIDLIFAKDDDAQAFLAQTDDGVEKIALPFANMARIKNQEKNNLQVSNLAVIQQGKAWVQDVAATIPVRLLQIEKNMAVADICSAPGGKARQIAAAGGEVTAVEQSGERVLLLQQNLRPFDSQAKIIIGDIITLTPPKKYERVLLDAPCSGTGTLRKNPDIAIIKTEKDIQQAAQQQKEILAKTWQWLAGGGVLVYAVCSLEREEGEAVVAHFLQKEKTARLLPIEKTADNLEFLPDDAFQHGFLRTLPHYLPDNFAGGMDGFFIARLQKI